MKKLLIVLVLFQCGFAQSRTINWPNDTLVFNSWKLHKNTIISVASRAQLDSLVSLVGSNTATLQIIDTITLTAHDTIPANIDLQFLGRGYITGAYNFVINKMSTTPLQQIADTGTNLIFGNSGAVSKVYSNWFGVKADSVTDDTKAFRNFAASVGGPNQPKHALIQEGRIRITKSIFWSDFANSGNTYPYNTVGFSWQGETHYWGGDWNKRINNLVIEGSGMAGIHDAPRSQVWFDGDSCYPVFVFVGGRDCYLKNVMISGDGTTHKASEGIFLTGGSSNFRLENSVIHRCIRGFRLGDMVNQTHDPIDFRAYDSLNAADPVTYGGWMVENIIIDGGAITCNDSLLEDRMCISMESAQTVHFLVNNTQFFCYGYYAIDVYGGYLQLTNPGLLGAHIASIHVRSDANSHAIKMYGGHDESDLISKGVPGAIYNSTMFLTSRAQIGRPFYQFYGVTGGDYYWRGGGFLEIKGGTHKNIKLGQNLDSYYQQVSVENASISGFVGSDDSASAHNVIMSFKDCLFNKPATGTAPWWSYFTYHKSNRFENCQFYGSGMQQSVLDMNDFKVHMSGNALENNTQIGMGQYVSNKENIGVTGNGQMQMRSGAWMRGDSLVSAHSLTGGTIAEVNYVNFNVKHFDSAAYGAKVTPKIVFQIDSTGNVDSVNNLKAKGKITFDGRFGQIGTHDDTTDISIATGSSYVKITGLDLTEGNNSIVIADTANDQLVFPDTGYYRISFNASGFSGTANVVYKFAVFVNGVEQNLKHSMDKFLTANDIKTIGGVSGYIHIGTANHVVDVRVRHDNGGTIHFFMTYGSLSADYVGNKQ